ncbi:unnamed protein product [Prorocentrum cordatum]|uniref:Armadillo repeat-containing protein 8 n=1 Tax=Prorocentrum cordatum TaxID=2364126 RepID=A0ABN9Q574_9DINO|nr:unnamed protein product [Polarella glacialis]
MADGARGERGADEEVPEECAAAAEDAGESSEGEPPELMDLIDAVEEAAADVEALAKVLRDIGRRIRLTPTDRDLLTDFEGTTQICQALAAPPHSWRGEAMVAFCRIVPDVCRTSVLNRGALRDEGFLQGLLGLLGAAARGGEEATTAAACSALSALCTASDGNKKAAAGLWVGVPGEAAAVQGMQLLVEVLGLFPQSAAVQTEGLSALRAMVVDDDSRKGAEEEAFAVLNRRVLMGEGFSVVHAAIVMAFATADSTSGQAQARLTEQALLMLREASREQDHIQEMAFGSKLQKRAVSTLSSSSDAKVVRASLAALRAFAFNEDAREHLALLSDDVLTCVAAVQKHVGVAAVCEQGFGLFVNLTLRKSPIAARLGDLLPLGQAVLRQHPDRPDIARSVTMALRNIASQVDAVGAEVRESGLFEQLRELVLQREDKPRWGAAVDAARQFLREFKADQGVQKKAVYNAYY